MGQQFEIEKCWKLSLQIKFLCAALNGDLHCDEDDEVTFIFEREKL